jgi:serine/threonine protein kinase
MAPEQIADAKSVGPPADVFALGAMLYECLAGEPAFEAATRMMRAPDAARATGEVDLALSVVPGVTSWTALTGAVFWGAACAGRARLNVVMTRRMGAQTRATVRYMRGFSPAHAYDW